jgi:hypothetical protein
MNYNARDMREIKEYEREEISSSIRLKAFFGELYLSKISDDKFVVGMSNQRKIGIYSFR